MTYYFLLDASESQESTKYLKDFKTEAVITAKEFNLCLLKVFLAIQGKYAHSLFSSPWVESVAYSRGRGNMAAKIIGTIHSLLKYFVNAYSAVSCSRNCLE